MPVQQFSWFALHVQVIVELKNDLAISGTLHSVDQYLNIKLTNIKVVNEAKYPHMVSQQSAHCRLLQSDSAETNKQQQAIHALGCVHQLQHQLHYAQHCNAMTRAMCCSGLQLQMSVRNCFIRGSVVRYVQVGEVQHSN